MEGKRFWAGSETTSSSGVNLYSQLPDSEKPNYFSSFADNHKKHGDAPPRNSE
jgi:hypothetical protein